MFPQLDLCLSIIKSDDLQPIQQSIIPRRRRSQRFEND